MPTLTINPASHPQTYAVTLTHNPTAGAAAMMNATQALRDQLKQSENKARAAATVMTDAAAASVAHADYLATLADTIEEFLAMNATELVNEAFDRLQVDESKVDQQQKTIDDQAKQITDLQSRAVDQATLDKIDTLLHPTPPADTTPGAAGGDATAASPVAQPQTATA